MSASMETKRAVWGMLIFAWLILMGAIGAHMIRHLVDNQTLDAYKTAVYYGQIHALALIFIPLSGLFIQKPFLSTTWLLILLGILLFSGSLCLLVLGRIYSIPLDFLGALTPVGGLLWIGTWLWTGIKLYKSS